MSNLYSCDYKESFKSKGTANKIRKNMMRRKTLGKRPVSVYKCKNCGFWHIGTKYSNKPTN